MFNVSGMNYLEEKIRKKRNELYLVESMYGISNQRTICCSKELDNLIIDFQRLKLKFHEIEVGFLLNA
ncbi:aspartyl-phosphate phosphatase Spo0E family protein [Cytobacillus oceanisediminis]|uniref:aspartyl-phosphate phosphatase Spo0E family protein n=1 Tax=Cytobacillus oceanisediminis TaxID=665099 RepID=UPI0011A888D6|nr:aspartyl-phosphate phosphatase Spo0E family protein [Cytobacillus oceanisediminis]MBZ9535809.1 aspartyl-phosphate phosphatase Spo0E family protein [Cytobacillus oceanisediminis]